MPRPYLFSCLVACCLAPGLSAREVKHPCLLINQQELDELRAKVKREPWKGVLEKVQWTADNVARGAFYETGLMYALTGRQEYLQKTRAALLQEAATFAKQSPDFRMKESTYYHEGPRFGLAEVGYDFIYHGLTPQERATIEAWLRTACYEAMKYAEERGVNPSMRGAQCGEIGRKGCVLGDDKIVDWASDYFKSDVVLGRFRDSGLWVEPQTYAQVCVCAMTAFAEALYRYNGTNLFTFKSPRGISLQSILDSQIAISYPLEKTGVGHGSIRVADTGHGCTRNPNGHFKDDHYLVNHTALEHQAETGAWYGVLEILYRRTRDPGYAWFLARSTQRNERTLQLGYTFLTHGELFDGKTLEPPAARSGMFPEKGFAFLRADESSSYWNGRGLAAFLQIHTRYFHTNRGEDFQLLLHGKGRLLYPEYLLVQYEPQPYQWTEHAIGHNTVMVDQSQFLGNQQQEPGGQPAARHEFNTHSKYAVVSGSTARDVEQSRALILTREYLLDLFALKSTTAKPHTYDWLLHGYGRLSVSGGSSFQQTDELRALRWYKDVWKRTTDRSIAATWVQRSGGVIPGCGRWTDEWFKQAVGVRMIMAGVPGTTIHAGNGPRVAPPHGFEEGNPEGALPMLLVRRQVADTIFCAVHEAFDVKDGPAVKSVTRIATGPDSVVVAVEGTGFSDRLLSTLGKDGTETALQWQNIGPNKNISHPTAKALEKEEASKLRKTIELQSQDDPNERFRFRNYGWIRIQDGKIVAEGGIEGFSLRAPQIAPGGRFLLNGREVDYRKEGAYCVYHLNFDMTKPKPPVAPLADDFQKGLLNIKHHEPGQRPRGIVMREDFPDQKVIPSAAWMKFPGFEDGFRDYVVEAPGYTVRLNRNYGGLVQLLDRKGNLWTARRSGFFRRNPVQIGMLFDWWGEKVVAEHRHDASIIFDLANGLRLKYAFENEAFEVFILNKDGSPFAGKLNGQFRLFVTDGSVLTWSDGDQATVTELGLRNPNPKKRKVRELLLQVPAFGESSLLVDGPEDAERQVELSAGLLVAHHLETGEKRWRLSFLDKERASRWLADRPVKREW